MSTSKARPAMTSTSKNNGVMSPTAKRWASDMTYMTLGNHHHHHYQVQAGSPTRILPDFQYPSTSSLPPLPNYLRLPAHSLPSPNTPFHSQYERLLAFGSDAASPSTSSTRLDSASPVAFLNYSRSSSVQTRVATPESSRQSRKVTPKLAHTMPAHLVEDSMVTHLPQRGSRLNGTAYTSSFPFDLGHRQKGPSVAVGTSQDGWKEVSGSNLRAHAAASGEDPSTGAAWIRASTKSPVNVTTAFHIPKHSFGEPGYSFSQPLFRNAQGLPHVALFGYDGMATSASREKWDSEIDEDDKVERETKAEAERKAKRMMWASSPALEVHPSNEAVLKSAQDTWASPLPTMTLLPYDASLKTLAQPLTVLPAIAPPHVPKRGPTLTGPTPCQILEANNQTQLAQLCAALADLQDVPAAELAKGLYPPPVEVGVKLYSYDASFNIAQAESSSALAQSSAAQVSFVSTATSASSSTAESPQRAVPSPTSAQSSPDPIDSTFASSPIIDTLQPAMDYPALAMILYKAILSNMLAFRKMAAAKRASSSSGSHSEAEEHTLSPLAQEVLMSVLSQTMQAFRTRKSLSQEQVQALLQHMPPSARETIRHVAQGPSQTGSASTSASVPTAGLSSAEATPHPHPDARHSAREQVKQEQVVTEDTLAIGYSASDAPCISLKTCDMATSARAPVHVPTHSAPNPSSREATAAILPSRTATTTPPPSRAATTTVPAVNQSNRTALPSPIARLRHLFAWMFKHPRYSAYKVVINNPRHPGRSDLKQLLEGLYCAQQNNVQQTQAKADFLEAWDQWVFGQMAEAIKAQVQAHTKAWMEKNSLASPTEREEATKGVAQWGRKHWNLFVQSRAQAQNRGQLDAQMPTQRRMSTQDAGTAPSGTFAASVPSTSAVSAEVKRSYSSAQGLTAACLGQDPILALGRTPIHSLPHAQANATEERAAKKTRTDPWGSSSTPGA